MSLYTIKRMFYWTAFSNCIIHVTPETLGEYFVKYRKESNIPIRENEPYTGIFEDGVFQHLIDKRNKEDQGLITRFAVMKDSRGLFYSLILGAIVFSIPTVIEFVIPLFMG